MMPKFILQKSSEMYKTADLLEEKKYKVKSEDKNYILLRKMLMKYSYSYCNYSNCTILFNYIIIITIIYFLYNFIKIQL